MSFEIVDALIHDQHFAVEAGVGIGKSFGYLVPVLLYNKENEKSPLLWLHQLSRYKNSFGMIFTL